MLSVSKFTKHDLPMINKAVRQAWPTTDQTRKTVVNVLTSITEDSEQKAATRISAANSLIKIEHQNQKERLATMGKLTVIEEISAMTEAQLLQEIQETERLLTDGHS